MTTPIDLDPDHAEHDGDRVLDDAVPSDGYERIPVVGLGGSAGAITALQQFFRALAPGTGLAYVVVIHLDAGHDSTLAEILQHCTPMPVVQLQQAMRIEADHVYVIPPRMTIEVAEGVLHLHPLREGRAPHVTVDLFLRTLADTHGAHAAAVVLSGADGDGSIGIKRIKERGGLTIAQDPDEAQHPSMPRGAIATGMVDWVLPVADMAPRLLAYFRLEKRLSLPPEEGRTPTGGGVDESDVPLRDVLTYLRTRTGRDFSAYKRGTVVRRIARRMQVNGTESLQDYLTCLRTRQGEAGALLQDLLISVTNFFRDAECFKAMDSHMAEVVRSKAPGEPLRAWVAGCATGEEAYSIAILLLERARASNVTPLIQVFATDLDEEAIRAAREAIYPSTIEADVSEERLRRYFVKEHLGYRVGREIREMVLFAQHDLLRDSPFSRLDLVSCRNLLIYLDRSAQQRVFQTLHFACLPNARLFLGASETVDEASNLFTVLDKKCRVFAKRMLPRVVLPAPVGPVIAASKLQVPQAPAATPMVAMGPTIELGAQRTKAEDANRLRWGELHFRLLESLAPPSILVDAEHEILHLSASAGRFLQFAGGEPSRNLMRVVHPAMRIELRALLYRASQGSGPAEVLMDPVDLDGKSLAVLARVARLHESGVDLFLITLEVRSAHAETAQVRPALQQDPVARHLDRELERLKQHLADTVEQYEASTEELKASNEELQAMNEELRAATEELETSREELQSINEELSTVNQELKSKVEELGDANSDMQNLINATAIAIVFLNRDLHVIRYTPSAVGLFNLIPTDVGRPLADMATRLQYTQLDADARQVLQTLVPVEREVGLPDGRWFLARLLPYRTLEDRIAGVVLSFIDITRRKQAEEVRLWLSAIVNSSGDAIVSFAPDGIVLSWNNGAQAIFGHAAAEMIGKPMARLWPTGSDAAKRMVEGVSAGRGVSLPDVECARKNGSTVHVSASASPIRDDDGRIIGGTMIARDVTDFRAATQALRESEERMRLIVENATEFAIFSIDLQRRLTTWNVGAQRLLGYAEPEVLGKSADIIFTPEDRAAGNPDKEAATALAQGRASDDRWHVRRDGSRFWASGVTMLMRNTAGEAVGFVKILRDQTAAREAQEALERSQRELLEAASVNERQRAELEAADTAKDRFLAVLSHELRNPLASISSAAALVAERTRGDEKQARARAVLERQAAVMKVLLDDLLDISRLRLGRLELHRRPTGLIEIVRAALESTRPLMERAGHKVELSLPLHELEVDGDPPRLTQVVGNLLTNAAKYTPPGGEISIAVQVQDDHAVVAVQDNGIGMEPDEIERMFQMFSQGSQALKHSAGGLGIGLALARNIVELHGGWIRAFSPGRGQGSRFCVGLPLLRATPANPTTAESPGSGSSNRHEGGELVLVADDNDDVIWGVTQLLESEGYRTLTATAGQQALELAKAHRPDVVMLDIGMPDMDGRDVARQIRATDWGARALLIAASGWGQEADIKRSLEAGFDAHLTKPIDWNHFNRLVAERSGRGMQPER